MAPVGILCVLAMIAIACAGIVEVPEVLGWEEWKVTFGRSYKSLAEERMRRGIYDMNVRRIEAHNSQGRSWRQGVNTFSDLTSLEWEQKMGFRKMPARDPLERTVLLPDVEGAGEIDWRSKGEDNGIKFNH